ncbi:MAG: CoA-binding protein [Cyanobacteria bacterium P01_D01_bin.14]
MTHHAYHDPAHDPANLRQVLLGASAIAIVGHSHKPHRASYQIGQYLKAQGYQVYPVNPRLDSIDGTPCYPSLQAVPATIDIVNVFRRSEFLADIATDVLALPPHPNRCFWTQLEIYDEAVAQKLAAAGITVVMNACIKIEHQSLVQKQSL